MYFSLPQLFVFLFDVLCVGVFAISDRFVKKNPTSNKVLFHLFLSFFLSLKKIKTNPRRIDHLVSQSISLYSRVK